MVSWQVALGASEYLRYPFTAVPVDRLALCEQLHRVALTHLKGFV